MLNKNILLSYYKRREIQEAMVAAAKGREVAVRFGEGFGKRPDVLRYSEEILDFAKQGVTSFHSSEEIWENPKMILPELKKTQIENLRKGWDLILDIDSPYWEISKITAWLIIKSLQAHSIKAVSVKFSGNKGFHIGVPFESFPEIHNNIPLKSLFPAAPRGIAAYLLDYIKDNFITINNDSEIVFGVGLDRRFKISYSKLESMTGKNITELTEKICSKCKKRLANEVSEIKIEFICPRCGKTESSSESYRKCSKCNVLMEKTETKKSLCDCGSDSFFIRFNPLSIIEVDTILISSRHLFRMPYSLHEKSGLASLPFNPDKILQFEKKYASPDSLKVSKHVFIDRTKCIKDEAAELLEKAMGNYELQEKKQYKIEQIENITEAIPEILFPPCIAKALEGLQDGKKRSLFILVNFLVSIGWSYEQIENRLKAWNEKNPEPLKEQILLGQIRYHQRNKEKILPPNCDNDTYYKSLHICSQDNLCKKIKNPVNYSIIKARIARKGSRKDQIEEDY